ncbi:MAG: MaoC family dehydratase [Acidimicrobiales bacterium]
MPFRVERGKVLELAAAAHHRSDLYSRAAMWSPEPVPAPLVFSRASVFAEERSTPVSAALGVAPDELRHAGHQWVVSGPLMSDTDYAVSPWTHQGTRHATGSTGAEHHFSTFARAITDRDGVEVQEERMTVVRSSGGRPVDSRPVPPSVAPDPVGGLDRPGSGAWLGTPAGELVAEIDLGQVSRTDIVRFAGAIGDFTAIHHDVEQARREGLSDVIAMGMFPAALMLAPVEEELGPYAIRTCSIQFRRIVYPGEPLMLAVRVEECPTASRMALSLRMTAAAATALTGRLVVDRPAAREWQDRVAP